VSVKPSRLSLQLVSVALAVLLWMLVAGEQTVERVFRVPLELQQFPAELELVGDFPTAVDVRVRGSGGALSRVNPGDIVAVLDLRGAEPGPKLFPLTPQEVRAPLGVEVVQVSPATVAMTFVNPAQRHTQSSASKAETPVERTFKDHPLELRNLPGTLTASSAPGQVDVTLSGARDVLVRFDAKDVTPFVDLSGLGVGEYALTVRADVVHDVTVGRIAPSTVQIRITNVR
jgi:YbbR domain-containing protein